MISTNAAPGEKKAKSRKAASEPKKSAAPKAIAKKQPALVESKAPRVTKETQVIDALCRPEGTTISEIMELIGWQAHSVQGFLSGTAKKKLGLTVERVTEDGRISYRIPSVPVEG